jgi:RNA polymerase sigma-70 factor (ECF subfamily)
MPLLAIGRSPEMEILPSRALPEANSTSREARLRDLVDRYIDFVARVLRNAGTPEAEIDDEVQGTFITASNRLDDVRPGAEKSFLLQVALHRAAHARRTAARRREVSVDEAPERVESLALPDQLIDRNRARQVLDQVLLQMDTELRTVFMLYEIEEMTMAEIANVLGIPPGTVASRLRRARESFQGHVRALEGVLNSKVES